MAFPKDVYEALRLEAFSRRISVNQLVVERVKPAKRIESAAKLKKKASENWRRMQAIGRKIRAEVGDVDAAKIIREERDRDNA